MRKPKATSATAAACKLALMESSNGVRTRAKTLALQQTSASYIQLRNRGLEKPPVVFVPKRRKSRLRSASFRKSAEKLGKDEEKKKKQERAGSGDKIEASSGKKTRNRRGFNPCTLLGDPDTDRKPSPITKPLGTSDTNRRMKKSTKRHKPTVHETDELFSGSEQEQQQQFIKKYNFDPVNDKPLPGRYQWEKLD